MTWEEKMLIEQEGHMKHWRVDYSIKLADGTSGEFEATFEAQNITIALAMAVNNIVDPNKSNPDIDEVVIWNIGIIAMPSDEDTK